MKRAVHAKGRRGKQAALFPCGRRAGLQAGGPCRQGRRNDGGNTGMARTNKPACTRPSCVSGEWAGHGCTGGGRHAGPRMHLRARGVMSPLNAAYAAKRRPVRETPPEGPRKKALADGRAAGMTAEIPVWPGQINLPAPGPPVLWENGRGMGARAGAGAPGPGCACGRGALCPPRTLRIPQSAARRRRRLRRGRLFAAGASRGPGRGAALPLMAACARRCSARACIKRPRVPVEHGAAFAMAFQKYFSAAACMAAHWASMSATSLNWVRQRSRFWPSRCVLK